MNPESRVVPLDASVRRQILELAKAHDEKLRSVEQDLIRAETKLKVEGRWRWFDRVICLVAGCGLTLIAWQTGFFTQMFEAAGSGIEGLFTYLRSTVSISGVPVPMNAIVFLAAAAIVALALTAIRSFSPSPKRAARELLKRFEDDQPVHALVFQNGTFPKSSYDILREEQGGPDVDFPEPTLEGKMQSVFGHAGARRTLQ